MPFTGLGITEEVGGQFVAEQAVLHVEDDDALEADIEYGGVEGEDALKWTREGDARI